MIKKFIFECIILFIVVVLSCFLVYKHFSNNKEVVSEEPKYKILIEKNNNGLKEELINETNKVYSYNSNITINLTNEELSYTLNAALTSELVRINELIDSLNKINVRYESAKEIYRNDAKTLTLIKCKNDKIILGNINLDLDKDLCDK